MSNSNSTNFTQLYLGVDGGGTSCRARDEDEKGNLLGEETAGPAATLIGIDRAIQAVRAASEAAAIDACLSPGALLLARRQNLTVPRGQRQGAQNC